MVTRYRGGAVAHAHFRNPRIIPPQRYYVKPSNRHFDPHRVDLDRVNRAPWRSGAAHPAVYGWVVGSQKFPLMTSMQSSVTLSS